jgi:two-component system, NarL family, sensor kinase
MGFRRLEQLRRKEKRLTKELACIGEQVRQETASLINELRNVRDGLLSLREQQVLGLVRLHKCNKEIGWELHIAERTVKFHITSLFRKLGAQSRYDL